MQKRKIIIVYPGQLHKVAQKVTAALLRKGINNVNNPGNSFHVRGWLDNRIDELVEFRKPNRDYDPRRPGNWAEGEKEGQPVTFEESCEVIDMPRGLISRIGADWDDNAEAFFAGNDIADIEEDEMVEALM
jgi:hypothetical protein